MLIGVIVEHLVPHVHTQTSLVESLIEHLQYISIALIVRIKLPIIVWGHEILLAATLIRLRPSVDHKHTPYQLAIGKEPNIYHLKMFGCTKYIPISPPQRTKMILKMRLEIYVGYESRSIIRYLEPLTCDIFQERFVDFHFDETKFPTLEGEIKKLKNEITWYVPHLLHLDTYNKIWEVNVKKIMYLQYLTNYLPNSFTDLKRVTKSHVLAINVPVQIEILNLNNVASTTKAHLKCDRPMGFKDKIP